MVVGAFPAAKLGKFLSSDDSYVTISSFMAVLALVTLPDWVDNFVNIMI